ncbi:MULTISPECIES: hypothetical protein [Amycolatopsis]|uniref:Uncharacterized protein n=1 Tax=Amycolatopsis albidoflavus TaxID=102226 RepID=A0ABW5I2W0_9PSEU
MVHKMSLASLAIAASVAGLALLPAAASAAPVAPAVRPVSPHTAPAFNASGSYTLFQSNGVNATVNVTQDSLGKLYGSATTGRAAGTIESGASVDGTSIQFTIAWTNGPHGRYTGSLGADRRLSGFTFDLGHPESQATWATTQTF